MKRVHWIGGVVVVLAMTLISFGGGFVLGLLSGRRDAFHSRYLEELNAIAPVLSGDPAFAEIEVHERSNGGVYLTGFVRNQRDQTHLRIQTVKAVGEARAKEITMGVSIRQ